MKEFYLLAAGLLTGFAVPNSTLHKLSNIPEEGLKLLSDLKPQAPSAVVNSTVPTVETSLTTETSSTGLPALASPAIKRAPVVAPRLISGPQLYYERLEALKSGQIHTRKADVTIHTLKLNNRRQLTYEDWKSLLTLEGRAMADGQGTNRLSVMLGDSLSMWFPKEKLPDGKLWLNQGISGDTSTGVLRRLSAFSSTKPEVIYLMAGVNDLRRGTKDEVILRNHRQIIRRLRQSHPKSQIIIQSILPTRLPTIPNTRIQKLNSQLARIAQQEGAYFMNIHMWFADFSGQLREDLTTDGLHLSQTGYDVWRWALEQVEVKLANAREEQPRQQQPTATPTVTPTVTPTATPNPQGAATTLPLPGLQQQ